jgi:protein ImuA
LEHNENMRVVSFPIVHGAQKLEAFAGRLGLPVLEGLVGGSARARVHEVYTAETEDAAAASGFAMGLAAGIAGKSRPILWLRSRRAARLGGVLQAEGWRDMGSQPGKGLVSVLPDATALLRAAVEGLRCPALSAVVVESWGPMRELDLTASRRLALATEKSGVPLLLLRMDATPVPSAAQTRWQVAAAPSVALLGNAPGHPCFDVTLLRQRGGPSGQSWRLEWDRDRCQFREAPLSGAVVPVPADRPAGSGRSRESRQAA